MAEKQEREPMKKTVRIALLMVGLVGTFVAASVAQVPAFDGGSIPLCPPSAAAELCR
jgi:energy-converting hydrogenase Eha subunit C